MLAFVCATIRAALHMTHLGVIVGSQPPGVLGWRPMCCDGCECGQVGCSGGSNRPAQWHGMIYAQLQVQALWLHFHAQRVCGQMLKQRTMC